MRCLLGVCATARSDEAVGGADLSAGAPIAKRDRSSERLLALRRRQDAELLPICCHRAASDVDRLLLEQLDDALVRQRMAFVLLCNDLLDLGLYCLGCHLVAIGARDS